MLVLQRAAAAMEGPLPFTPRTAITHLPRSVGAGPAMQNERAIYAHHPTLGGRVRGKGQPSPAQASQAKNERQAHLLGEKFHADGTSTQNIPAEERLVSCAWQKLPNPSSPSALTGPLTLQRGLETQP